MTEAEKIAEFEKVVPLVAKLIEVVDDVPIKRDAVTVIYSDIRKWYTDYQNKEKQ